MITQKVMPFFLTCSNLTRTENKCFQGQILSKFVQIRCYDVVFVKGYKMSPSLLKLDNHSKSYALSKFYTFDTFCVFNHLEQKFKYCEFGNLIKLVKFISFVVVLQMEQTWAHFVALNFLYLLESCLPKLSNV